MKPFATEVLVAGGGVAGCCAAIAAARSGVQTLLVEQQSYLGGTGYAGMLQHICGLYLNGPFMPSEPLNTGLTQEIVRLLHQHAPERTVQKIGRVYVLPYAIQHLQTVLSSLMQAEHKLSIRCNTAITGVEAGSGSVRGVTVVTHGETQSISAAGIIDCTGNGNVAVLAGAEYELSSESERQLAGFVLGIGGLQADDRLSIQVPYYCAKAVAAGILPPAIKFSTFSYGVSPGEGFIKLSVVGSDTLARDEQTLKDAHTLFEYLGQMVPAFKQAAIIASSLKVIDREGRRIIGQYMLTEGDILSAGKFPDAVVKNAWPIELWDSSKGTLYKYLPDGEFYEIPLGCLRVNGFSNLLTAGRCISASHEALGSTRVMGTCMALGEQAGLAAARSVKNVSAKK